MRKWIIGIDEVGRGPVAGPVYMCAVAIPKAVYMKKKIPHPKDFPVLTDSKKMTERNRELWYDEAIRLQERGDICIALASKSARVIDAKGINHCITVCIATLLQELAIHPKDCQIFLDGGLRAPKEYQQQETVIKGDAIHPIISLASVVAKVTRDILMVRVAKKHPVYGWDSNKGYGTKAHIAAVMRWGTTPLHRKSFLRRVLDK